MITKSIYIKSFPFKVTILFQNIISWKHLLTQNDLQNWVISQRRPQPIYKQHYRWNHITNSISTVAHSRTLRDDNNIVITKPDKGRGVVILNRDDYFSKINTILSDSSKFKPFRLLRSIRTSIGEMTYNLLTISGSKPGRLYGLPKIHKIGQPLRPIISAIGTFNYNVAKLLVQIITPLTTNEYTIENSFSFIKEISDLKPLLPVTMASFDIESLFTNVPLNETTDIILNKTASSLLNSYGLNKTKYRKLLDIAATYTQVDGVAIGSPLGPCYANTFL
nr:uncharacterized protein LOC113803492 [Penaeus vannamei]